MYLIEKFLQYVDLFFLKPHTFPVFFPGLEDQIHWVRLFICFGEGLSWKKIKHGINEDKKRNVNKILYSFTCWLIVVIVFTEFSFLKRVLRSYNGELKKMLIVWNLSFLEKWIKYYKLRRNPFITSTSERIESSNKRMINFEDFGSYFFEKFKN